MLQNIPYPHYCLPLFLFFLSHTASAQFGPPIPEVDRSPSSELISEGLANYDMENFEEAIEYYLKVSPSDTNYHIALDELTLAYLGAGSLQKALAASDRLFALPNFTPSATNYTNRAAVLEKMGQWEEAINTYKEGLELFPFYYLTHYNLGVIEYNRRNYAKAYQAFLQAVQCNPYHRNSLLFLGQLELNQGHFAKALLCFENCIMAQPNHHDNPGLIQTLEKVASINFDIQLNPDFRGASSNQGFEALDQLLRSGAALEKSYRLKPKKADYAFIRHTQLLMESLDIERLKQGREMPEPSRNQKALEDTLATAQAPSPLPLKSLSVPSDPWIHTWAPLHKAIYEEKLFKAYAYTLIVSANNEKANKRFKRQKRKGRLEPLYALIKGAWSELAPLREVHIGGEALILQSWFDKETDHLIALGNLEDGERHGYWRFFQANHRPTIEGFFQNGTRNGPWRNYGEKGRLKEAYTHKDGKAQGFYQAYTQGQLREQSVYAEEQVLEGPLLLFYLCGSVKETYRYLNGKREGENKLFYPQGQLQGSYQYSNDLLSGPAKTYYPNGQTDLELNFNQDLREGKERGFHPNGQPAHTGQWQGGYKVGKWVYYDDQGRMQERMSFDEAGNQVGLYERYSKGKKAEELRFFNGRLIGKQLYLDTATGNPYAAYYYDPAQIDSVVFYNAATGEVVERMEGGEQFDLQIYDPKGRLYSEGEQQGLQQAGNWTVYFPSGEVAQTYRLYNGTKDGPHYKYFPTGPMREVTHYQNGWATGYAGNYYPDGTVMRQGWLEQGQKDGAWEEFYPDSTLKETSYWIRGIAQGWKHSYAPNGQKDHSTYTDEMGQTLEVINYDELGNIVERTGALGSEDTLRLYHPNGTIKMEVPLQCYRFSDMVRRFYPSGQLYSEEEMQAGIREGMYRAYHPNGEIWIEGKNKDGQAWGKWSWFNQEGQLIEEGTFENGQLEGISSRYYASGQLKDRGHFHLDKRHGRSQYYSPQGDLAGEFWYEDGALRKYRHLTTNPKEQLYSDWKAVTALGTDTIFTYFQNGNEAIEYQLKNARLHGMAQYFHSNGELQRTAQYLHQLKNGNCASFSAKGRPVEQATYLQGLLHGTQKHFDEKGRLTQTQEYLNGEPHGKQQKLDPETGEVKEERVFWNGFAL